MKKMILIGSGGHANSVYDVILSAKSFSIEKVIDKTFNKKFFKEFQISNQKTFLSNNKTKKNIHLSFSSIYDLEERSSLFKTLKKKKNL